jgi:hypothetical protein
MRGNVLPSGAAQPGQADKDSKRQRATNVHGEYRERVRDRDALAASRLQERNETRRKTRSERGSGAAEEEQSPPPASVVVASPPPQPPHSALLVATSGQAVVGL